MNTTAPEIYFGLDNGEITCIIHAGVTLTASIQNARKDQVNFDGINGETYVRATDEELAEMGLGCEYC
jgi:hypothetical protein